MRIRTLLVGVIALFVLSGCCLPWCAKIDGQRLHQINEGWMRTYTVDRKMTADEAKAYAALTEEQKEAWAAEGKPTPMPLSERMLDAARDYHAAVKMEAEAAE